MADSDGISTVGTTMERCAGSRIAHDVAARTSARSRVDVPHPFGTDGRTVGVYVRTNELRFRSGPHTRTPF